MKVLEFIKKHKYLLTILLFACLLFFGNNRISINRELKKQIREKEKVIEEERLKIDSVEMYMEQLRRDPDMQEGYVRNRYHMKKPDEDIFLVSRPQETAKKKKRQ